MENVELKTALQSWIDLRYSEELGTAMARRRRRCCFRELKHALDLSEHMARTALLTTDWCCGFAHQLTIALSCAMATRNMTPLTVDEARIVDEILARVRTVLGMLVRNAVNHDAYQPRRFEAPTTWDLN
jgi:hypothetical protein